MRQSKRIYKIKCKTVIINVNQKSWKNIYQDFKYKLRKKMKTLDIKNWEKLKVWKILEKLFRIFLFPSFQLVPTAKIKFNNL